MFSHLPLCWLILVAFLRIPVTEGTNQRVHVTLRDGTTMEIREAQFEYHWVNFYETDSGGQVVDLSSGETEEYPGFRYLITISAVELARNAPFDQLESIVISWREGFGIKNFCVTFKDGRSETSQSDPSKWTHSRLIGGSLYERGYASLAQLSLTGKAVVEGQEGRFQAFLLCWRRVCREDESLEEVRVP